MSWTSLWAAGWGAISLDRALSESILFTELINANEVNLKSTAIVTHIHSFALIFIVI